MKLSTVVEDENKRIKKINPVQHPINGAEIKKELDEIKELLTQILEKLEK
jgi:hypothetical protein